MASGLYDADGKIRLTQSPGSGFCGRYAPDGSIYFTTAPGSGFCGSTAPDGSMYIVDATGSTTIGVYAPNGAIRVTTGNEYNGAWRVSGVSSVVASWDASTSTLALLAAITTHTRASLATMFDSTGKLTYAPNNLLLQSNNFSNAAWTLSNATLASGVTDPLGGTNAWTLTATGASGMIYQGPTITGPNTLFSVWVKRRTGSGAVNIRNQDGTTTVVTVTGAWTQVSNTPKASASTNIWIQMATSGDAIDIYAATMSAVTYETTPRTADQVITTSAAYYGPRIDYDPNTLAVKGLLIEEARTNLAIQSGNFASGWTFTAATRSTDGTLAPDGATSAAKMTLAASAASHEFYNTAAITTTSSATYTGSIFVKKGNYRYVSLTIENTFSAGAIAVFDLDAPTSATQTWAVGTGAYTSSSITNVGNGWYRLTITGVPGAGTTSYLIPGFVQAATGNPTTSVEPLWTAAGTEYGYFFGGQLELGPFATSYIPTAASSVTRAADVVQFTGAALTALQGSAFSAIGEAQTIAAPAIQAVLFGANSGVAFVYAPSVNNQSAFYDGTSLVAIATAGGGRTWSGLARAGIGVSGSTASEVMTGGTVGTGSHALPARTTAYLGTYSGGAYLNGWVKSFAIYNQRLSDATLQAKSVVGASY